MLYLYYGRLQQASTAEGSVAVRTLLAQILTQLDLPPQSIEKSCQGRPFLPSAPFLDISFSHTATLAACALLDKRPLLSEAASSTEAIQAWQIGVDAEPLTSPSSRDPHAFSHRFFGKHEQALVATASDAARAMLEIFTVKEAYAKQCGEGLARHLSGSDTMAPDFCKRNGVCFKRFLLAHHTLALCLPSSLANIDVKYIEVDL